MYFGDLVQNIQGKYNEQVNLNGYIFDGYIRMENQGNTVITTHPVETGSNITDNAYIEPINFSLEVIVSDSNSDRVVGQFGNSNRPINAYNLVEGWRKARTPIMLNCKYGFFQNVLVKSITSTDDYTTMYSWRATIALQEIIITSTRLVKISAATWYTNTENRGNQNIIPVEETNRVTIARAIEDAIIGEENQ